MISGYRDFILASPEVNVNELMDARYISLHVNDDQELLMKHLK